MPKLTTKQLISNLEKSGLIEPARLAAAIDDFRRAAAGQALDDVAAQRLIDYLVEKAGLLTPWQSHQLLKGRYKGFHLKDYKLLTLIGSGGMSKIFLAEHGVMGRRVAIKVLPRQRLEKASSLERFRREAQAIAALDHPNIIRVYDVDVENDTHFIVMEFVEGRDLHQVVASDGPLPMAKAVEYVRQAAEGLGHAHASGLIHRDVKPANLFLEEGGGIKVLDLGLALFEKADLASLTVMHNDGILGSADFLAPEQAIDSHAVDARADIYALGCCFHFLLTGQPPFDGGTLAKRILMHQKSPPPPLREKRHDAPDDLAALVARMMAKRPEDRFKSAHDAADAMSEWLVRHGHATESDFRDAVVLRLQSTPVEEDEAPFGLQRLAATAATSFVPDKGGASYENTPLPRVDELDAFSIEAFLTEVDAQPSADYPEAETDPQGAAAASLSRTRSRQASGAGTQWALIIVGVLVALIVLAQIAALLF